MYNCPLVYIGIFPHHIEHLNPAVFNPPVYPVSAPGCTTPMPFSQNRSTPNRFREWKRCHKNKCVKCLIIVLYIQTIFISFQDTIAMHTLGSHTPEPHTPGKETPSRHLKTALLTWPGGSALKCWNSHCPPCQQRSLALKSWSSVRKKI